MRLYAKTINITRNIDYLDRNVTREDASDNGIIYVISHAETFYRSVSMSTKTFSRKCYFKNIKLKVFYALKTTTQLFSLSPTHACSFAATMHIFFMEDEFLSSI